MSGALYLGGIMTGFRSTGSNELRTVRHVSSAFILGVEDIQTTCRQVVYVDENSRGPKIEPCGQLMHEFRKFKG